jgi:hypothetical protein
LRVRMSVSRRRALVSAMMEDIPILASVVVGVLDRSGRTDSAVERAKEILRHYPLGESVAFRSVRRVNTQATFKRRFGRVSFDFASVIGSDRLLDDFASVEDDRLSGALVTDGVEYATIWLSEDMSQLVGCIAGLFDRRTNPSS